MAPGAIWTEIESGFNIELKTAIRINVFPLLCDQQVVARPHWAKRFVVFDGFNLFDFELCAAR